MATIKEVNDEEEHIPPANGKVHAPLAPPPPPKPTLPPPLLPQPLYSPVICSDNPPPPQTPPQNNKILWCMSFIVGSPKQFTGYHDISSPSLQTC